MIEIHNKTFETYDEALRWAARKGHLDVVNRLLAIESVLDNVTAKDNYALRCAAENGHLDVVNKLLEIQDVLDNVTAKNNYALRLAAKYGHLDVVNRLLEIQDVLDNVTAENNFALRWAIFYDNPDVVNRLLEIQDVLDNVTAQNNYALRLAAKNGYLDIVNRLLEIQDVLDNVTAENNCALRSAIFFDHPDVVNRLLQIESVLQLILNDEHHLILKEALKNPTENIDTRIELLDIYIKHGRPLPIQDNIKNSLTSFVVSYNENTSKWHSIRRAFTNLQADKNTYLPLMTWQVIPLMFEGAIDSRHLYQSLILDETDHSTVECWSLNRKLFALLDPDLDNPRDRMMLKFVGAMPVDTPYLRLPVFVFQMQNKKYDVFFSKIIKEGLAEIERGEAVYNYLYACAFGDYPVGVAPGNLEGGLKFVEKALLKYCTTFLKDLANRAKKIDSTLLFGGPDRVNLAYIHVPEEPKATEARRMTVPAFLESKEEMKM